MIYVFRFCKYDASFSAKEYCTHNKMSFVHPFDDEKVIEGQATIALEILEQSKEEIDYLFFVPCMFIFVSLVLGG